MLESCSSNEIIDSQNCSVKKEEKKKRITVWFECVVVMPYIASSMYLKK